MIDTKFIIHALQMQNLPAYKSDIPHIESLLNAMNRAETSLRAFPNLNEVVPITIVDKELMK